MLVFRGVDDDDDDDDDDDGKQGDPMYYPNFGC